MSDPTDPSIRATARTTSDDGYFNRIVSGHFEIVADEPAGEGGTDLGPAPFQLLLAALAACSSMTVRMYAKRKGWPLGRIEVDLSILKADAAAGRPRDKVIRKLTLGGDLTPEQREKCLEIAKKCPVARTLEAGADIESTLA